MKVKTEEREEYKRCFQALEDKRSKMLKGLLIKDRSFWGGGGGVVAPHSGYAGIIDALEGLRRQAISLYSDRFAITVARSAYKKNLQNLKRNRKITFNR